MRKVIYTIITGQYDTLKEPLVVSEGWDYVCLTDTPERFSSPTWKIVPIVLENNDTIRTQRKYKIRHDLMFPGAGVTCYVDGSTQLLMDINPFFSQHFRGGITIKKHPTRDCYIKEAKRCIELKKDNEDTINTQVQRYICENFPSCSGLYETGFMIRAINSVMNSLMLLWWQEVERGSVRDQISLPYILWKHKYKPDYIHDSIANEYIKIHPHNSAPWPYVKHVTPGRGDKNIGKAYNEECSRLSKNAWICIRDGDSMFLYDHWPAQIENVVQGYGKEYALIGCITNRLGAGDQLHTGQRDENSDIMHHRAIAYSRMELYGSKVKAHNKPIAGLFMLFNKTTWERVGGFDEKSIHCDTSFSRKVLETGGKIGLATGVYLFHYYRMHKDVRDKTHLL